MFEDQIYLKAPPRTTRVVKVGLSSSNLPTTLVGDYTDRNEAFDVADDNNNIIR